MKNNSAVISIGIPIFNGESFIERTIKSLRNQTFENFEVILYDDCSKDKSLGILLHLIEDDSRFKVILGKKNIGNVPKIMKEIIFPYSNGEYFMYMSQDDFLDKNALEYAIENLSKTNSEITIFDFVYYQTFMESKKIKGYYNKYDLKIEGREAFLASLDWHISGAGLYKRDLIEKIGYFDFNMYADEFSVRLFMLNAKSVSFNRGIFFYNTVNPNAITRKMKPELFSKLYKEVRLLNVVHENFDSKVFTQRYIKVIQMFFDYKSILRREFFTDNDRRYIWNQMIEARIEMRKCKSYFPNLTLQPKIFVKILLFNLSGNKFFKVFFLK